MPSFHYTNLPFVPPSVVKFVDRVCQDLKRGRSVIVLLPKTVPADDIRRLIDRNLWHDSLDTRTIALNEVGHSHEDFISVLSAKLGVEWSHNQARTIYNLLSGSFDIDILYLEQIESASSFVIKEVQELIGQWAEETKRRMDAGGEYPAICMVAQAPSILPSIPVEDTYLSVYWWWGFPSILEMNLLCRHADNGYSQDTETRWRESVFPHLVGTDLGLLSMIWEHTAQSNQHVSEVLQEYASTQGWKVEDIKNTFQIIQNENERTQRGSVNQAPPIRWRQAWAQGLLSQSIEFGAEIHPAALAYAGYSDSISHRAWRGQMVLLSPLLDQIRLSICMYLTDTYGNEWPFQWIPPIEYHESEAVKRNPLSCQWGHLKHLIQECEFLADQTDLAPLVRHAQRLRNTLSHYNVISLDDYKTLLMYIERSRQKISRI